MKDIKHIRRDFHSVALVMPQGWDLGIPRGVEWSKNIFLKFNQICCVSNLHQWHMQRHIFFGPDPWGPREGPKGQISLNLNHSQFQRFYKPNFVFLLTIERYKTYQTWFSFRRLGHAPGVGLGDTMGGLGGPKFFFFPNSTRFGVWVTYMNGTCNSTIFRVPASWGLGEGPKGQMSLNLNYKVNFEDFWTKLCVSSHKWKI